MIDPTAPQEQEDIEPDPEVVSPPAPQLPEAPQQPTILPTDPELAASQNLPAGATAETRPQAIMETPDSQKSEVQRAREAEGGGNLASMPAESFTKASETEQARQADEESRTPRLIIGEPVKIIAHEDETMVGRNAVVIEIEFTDRGAADARSGDKKLHDFAEVQRYIVRTRDEGPHRVECLPEQIVAISRTNLVRTTQ